jgi:osmotically-inducible protein OsmY
MRDDQYRDRWSQEGGQRYGGQREGYGSQREGYGGQREGYGSPREGYGSQREGFGGEGYGQRRQPRNENYDDDRWSEERGARYGQQSRGDFWEQDDYSRERGPSHHRQSQYGYGQPNPHGAQYEQGGRYPGSRPYGDRQWEAPAWERRARTAGTWGGESGRAYYGAGHEDRTPYDYGSQDRGQREQYQGSGQSSEFGGYQGGMQPRPGRQSRIDPKGYTRSDERVREHVCEHLGDSGLDVRDVEVTVKDGTVTLQGNVPDRRTKHAVEDCADGCVGVKDVDNRLKVSSNATGGTSGGPDASGSGSSGSRSPGSGTSGSSGAGSSGSSGTSLGAGSGRQAPGQHT